MLTVESGKYLNGSILQPRRLTHCRGFMYIVDSSLTSHSYMHNKYTCQIDVKLHITNVFFMWYCKENQTLKVSL